NLKQIGLALASYTGDYSGYLPSWAGWTGGDTHWCDPSNLASCSYNHSSSSGSNPASGRYIPLYSDIRYQNRSSDPAPVGVTYANTTPVPFLNRTIAWGRRLSSGKSSVANGDLFCAPNGLGFLLTSGYIQNAGVFYCPSATNMPGENIDGVDNGFFGGANLSDWRTAGGMDGATLHYGDWRNVNPVKWNFWAYGVFSHYGYRCVPLAIMNGWHEYEDRGCDGGQKTLLPGVKPNHHVGIGEPVFRTVRELGARAVVVDSFSKVGDMDCMGVDQTSCVDTAAIAGKGIKAHRVAYNVLFGDGRVSVYGDPDERILWSRQVRNKGGAPKNCVGELHVLGSNYTYGDGNGPFYNGTGGDPDHFAFSGSNFGVWHGLDQAGGVDK
ncbi:MAG: hypothetical protein HQ582_26160, partial [Planctomycetes bacterium]|nr:hypothetical protein [Planctomycetota bacterium]